RAGKVSNASSGMKCVSQSMIIDAPDSTGCTAVRQQRWMDDQLRCASRQSQSPQRKQRLRVRGPYRFLVRVGDSRIVTKQFHVLEFHSAARVVVRVISCEEETLGPEKLDDIGQFRLFGFDGPVEVVPEVVTRVLLVLLAHDGRRDFP